MSAPSKFDWTEDKDSIVVPATLTIAIYSNAYGQIVLRQQDQYGDEDDWIVFSKEHARVIAEAIIAEAGQELDASQAPLSPAERSRRYRHKQKNGGVTANEVLRDEARDGEHADVTAQ